MLQLRLLPRRYNQEDFHGSLVVSPQDIAMRLSKAPLDSAGISNHLLAYSLNLATIHVSWNVTSVTNGCAKLATNNILVATQGSVLFTLSVYLPLHRTSSTKVTPMIHRTNHHETRSPNSPMTIEVGTHIIRNNQKLLTIWTWTPMIPSSLVLLAHHRPCVHHHACL